MWLKPAVTAARVPAHCGLHVERVGSRALLCATEPLDLPGAARLLERARPLVRNSRVLIVDLRDAGSIDSAGVHVLLELADLLAADRKALCLVVRPNSPVERVLSQSNLTEQFQCFSTLERAWEGGSAEA